MKLVHIPHQNRHVKIGGCRLPKHPPVGLKLAHFLAKDLPAPPATADWTPLAMSTLMQIEGNDVYGDCVFAENAHFVGVTTGNANTLFSYSEAQTLADYSAETGFNPSDPSTDNGADPTTDLNYFTQHPYADGTKLVGWALVDATNKQEVQLAIDVFGGLKCWFGIPDGIINSMPTGNGFVWTSAAGAPDPNNGHCIGGYGYDVLSLQTPSIVSVTAKGPVVATWGMLGIIEWDAFASWFSPANGGGLAVRITPDWVKQATGTTPTGLNLSALVAACNAWFGANLPPVPAPAPGPSPTPTAATLAAAQAAVNAAFQGSFPLLEPSQAASIADAALATLVWP